MRRLVQLCAILLICILPCIAQEQHDRIASRGTSTFDAFRNTAQVTITGATPSVANGNVFKTNNASVTTITNFLGGSDTQQIVILCGDSNTVIANGTNIAVTGGTNFSCAANTGISFVFDASQSLWIESGGTGNGAGGGCTPGAPAGALQKNNGSGGCSASIATDNGTTLAIGGSQTVAGASTVTGALTAGSATINGNSAFKGPNPYTDVTVYGVRALVGNQTPAVAGITASVSSGNPQITISTNTCSGQPQVSNACFLPGDGVTIYNVGPATALTTPSAPTVTPSQAQAGTGTNRVVSSPAGASTFNYRVLACDINLGCTASSPTGTTTTGNALGAQSIAVSSITRALDVLTFNTASQPNISVGTVVHVDGCSNADNQNGFCGWFKVSTVTGTGFTSAQTGLTTVNGAATTSAGGGTANWWNANHVSWTGQSGVFRYVIQSDRQSPGTFVNIGMSWAVNPQSPATFTDGTLTFDDFGQTMMSRSAASIPAYVPTNGSATNDALTTTVTNVSGTTLTLAVAPSQNLSGQTILFDDAPTELAAISAAPTAVWFATPGAGTGYVTNSILNLTGAGLSKTLLFPVGASFNDTVVTGTNPNWYGNQMGVAGSSLSFTPKSVPQISFGSTPGLLISGGQGGEINSLQFNGAANGIAVQQDGGGGNLGTTYNFVNFNGAGLSSDYMSMGFLCRGAPAQASCLSKMGTVLINAGTQSMTDTSFTPSAYWDDSGDSTIQNLMGSARGMQVRGDPAGSQLTIAAYHWQGGTSPLVTVSNTGGTNVSLGTLGESIVDTGANAVVFNVGDSNQSVSVSCGSGLAQCGFGSSALPALTGQALGFVTGTLSGQNKSAISGSNFTDNSVQVNGIGELGYAMAAPGAPTLSISGASGPPANTYYYSLVAYDPSGNSTTVGAVSSGITVNGSQGVLVTFPALAPGQVATSVCRSTAAGTIGACNVVAGNGFKVTGTSFLDNGTFFPSNSAPTANRAISHGASSVGLSSSSINLFGGGFVSNEVGSFTATRTWTRPDLTGTAAAVNVAQSWSGNQSNMPLITPSIGGETISAAPRGSYNAFLLGALTATGTGQTFTLDKGITVTRVQVQLRVAPSGCGTAPVIRVSDGTNNLNLTLSAAANDSGAVSQNFAAGAVLTIATQTAALGCTTFPGDANVEVQFKMQ